MLCLWPVYKAFPNKRGFEKTYESPHWRETFWLYPLWQEIHSVIASTTTCQGSFCREDIVTSPVSKFLICQTICLIILDKTLTDCLQALVMSHYLKRNQRQYTAARLHLFSFLPAFALSCYQYGVAIVFHSKFCQNIRQYLVKLSRSVQKFRIFTQKQWQNCVQFCRIILILLGRCIK